VDLDKSLQIEKNCPSRHLTKRTMTPEDCAEQIASLKRQRFFHHERRKMVKFDPMLIADERVEHQEYHDRLVMRLLWRRIDLEGTGTP